MWLWIIAVIILAFGWVVLRGAPYVPSQKRYIKRAFTELYPLSNKDVVVDAGSGDGVVLRQVAIIGARAIGYEINPILVLAARFISRKNTKIRVVLADFWKISLPDDTTIVYAFMVSRDAKKMVDKMQAESERLNKTLMFISYGIALPGIIPRKNLDAYHLYEFRPLHSVEP